MTFTGALALIVASASRSLMNSAAPAAQKASSTDTPNARWKPSSARSITAGSALSPSTSSSCMCVVRMLARIATPSETPIWRCVEKIELARPVSAGEIVA